MITKTTTGVAVLATGLVSSLALAADKHEHHEHGVKFTAKGKETTAIRINGRLHFQYDGLALDETGAATNDENTNRFYFRRLRLGAKAKLNDGWSAETVYDFAGNNVSADKAIITKSTSFFDQKAKINFGYQKVPFGLEETNSSASIPTIERSAATRLFSDDLDFGVRHTGVHFSTIGKKATGFVYAISLANSKQGTHNTSVNSGGDEDGEAENKLGVWARAQYKFDAKTTLVGVDYGQAENAKLGDDFAAYSVYGKTKIGDISLQAEYLNGEADDKANGETTGYYILASTKIGKWEPVVRYSYAEVEGLSLDVDDLIRRAPKGSELSSAAGEAEISSLYFGVNYHVNKAVKYMIGYELAEAENQAGDEQDIDGIRARVQLLF